VIVGEKGEVVPVGKPVLVLEAGKPWFVFTLREDALGRLTVGRDVDLTTASGQKIAARVVELRPLGEFATWRAARAVGDHDLNSFRLRLDPLAAADGLRPGMTVWLAAGGK
jgi:HlyD family secretion protein